MAFKALRRLAFIGAAGALRPLRLRATHCAATDREIPDEFREISGKFGASWRVPAHRQFAFASFRFDPRTGQLWRDGSEVKLAPRAAAVLHLLAERAQELVTKQDLVERVWGGMAVGDDALTSCIQELRGVLGDDARHPNYIETRHRRGYRLMVPTTVDEQSGADAPTQVASPESSRLVGRVAEFGELARVFDQARSGRRQIVFISGEPGIGKSSLAEVFLEQLRTSQTVRDRARPMS